MRIKTELTERPPEFTVSREGQKAVIIFYTDVVEKQREGEDGQAVSYWEAMSWTMEVPWTDNIEYRINSNLAAWLALAQRVATELAATAARAMRDELLKESDALMALDRLGLTVPTGTTFTSWLSFLRGIGEALTGAVKNYRQALRDVPEQEGFPFDIVWPEKP